MLKDRQYDIPEKVVDAETLPRARNRQLIGKHCVGGRWLNREKGTYRRIMVAPSTDGGIHSVFTVERVSPEGVVLEHRTMSMPDPSLL